MRQVRHLSSRARNIIQARGVWGFLKFTFSRILRVAEDLVFEKHLLTSKSKELFSLGEYSFAFIDSESFNEPQLQGILSQILSGENEVYRAGLAQEDKLFVVINPDQHVLHYSFVQFVSRYKHMIGENMSVPLFTNCWTDHAARGQRLYPMTLIYGSQKLAEIGFSRAVITCDPSNVASVKGIERADFQYIAHIKSLVFLSRLVLQRVCFEDGRVELRLRRL